MPVSVAEDGSGESEAVEENQDGTRRFRRSFDPFGDEDLPMPSFPQVAPRMNKGHNTWVSCIC